MRYYTFFRLTMLKLIIDFNTLLIGAERPRKAKRLERKSTDKFQSAFTFKGTFSVPSV